MDDGRTIRLSVTEANSGERLDKGISEAIDDLSRSAAAKLIAEGLVAVNGVAVTKASHRLEEGDSIEVQLPAPVPVDVVPQDIPLEILYEDEEIAVIDKPAGMVVHPSAGHEDETLVNALLHHLESLSGVGGEARPGLVHRLDKGTSGLMVVAKTDRAHHALQREWSSENVRKVYIALVYGSLSEDEQMIDAPIGRHRTDRKRMAVVENGRSARTICRMKKRFRELSLVECELLTGRTHQIRVHLEHVGRPIVGDPVYGGPRWKGFRDKKLASKLSRLDRPMLHAAELSFPHPVTNQSLRFTASLPEDFSTLLESLSEA